MQDIFTVCDLESAHMHLLALVAHKHARTTELHVTFFRIVWEDSRKPGKRNLVAEARHEGAHTDLEATYHHYPQMKRT
jgi:hypothetical protein